MHASSFQRLEGVKAIVYTFFLLGFVNNSLDLIKKATAQTQKCLPPKDTLNPQMRILFGREPLTCEMQTNTLHHPGFLPFNNSLSGFQDYF